MIVVGIIGKIGSGKSLVSEYLVKNYNAIAFYCDDIAKEMIEKGEYSPDFSFSDEIFTNKNIQENIRINFHPLVFRRINESINNINNFLEKNNFKNFFEQKSVNTKKNNNIKDILNKYNINNLNNINNKNNYSKNNICEDIVSYQNINNYCDKNNFCEQLIIIESALPSDDMFNMCDKVIFVDSPYADRLNRLREKRGYTDLKIKQIDDSQKYYDRFYDKADFKIVNDGLKSDLEDRIKEVMNEIYFAGK